MAECVNNILICVCLPVRSVCSSVRCCGGVRWRLLEVWVVPDAGGKGAKNSGRASASTVALRCAACLGRINSGSVWLALVCLCGKLYVCIYCCAITTGLRGGKAASKTLG